MADRRHPRRRQALSHHGRRQRLARCGEDLGEALPLAKGRAHRGHRGCSGFGNRPHGRLGPSASGPRREEGPPPGSSRRARALGLVDSGGCPVPFLGAAFLKAEFKTPVGDHAPVPMDTGERHEQDEWRAVETRPKRGSLAWIRSVTRHPLARSAGPRRAVSPGPRLCKMAFPRTSTDHFTTAHGAVNWTYSSAAGINKSL